MRTAYWLSFALALTPFIMQSMAMFLGWAAFARFFRQRNGNVVASARQPVWPLVLFALCAFALTLWHSVYVDSLFASYSYDYGVQNTEVLGVSIPLELGEQVDNFVSSAFELLLNLVIVGAYIYCIVVLSRDPKVKTTARRWFVGFLFFIILVQLFFMWRSLPYRLEDFRALL